MKVLFPVDALTRSKQPVKVLGPVTRVYPYAVQGNSQFGVELWHRDGHWREDKTPHPMDIVALVDPEGALVPLTDHFHR